MSQGPRSNPARPTNVPPPPAGVVRPPGNVAPPPRAKSAPLWPLLTAIGIGVVCVVGTMVIEEHRVWTARAAWQPIQDGVQQTQGELTKARGELSLAKQELVLVRGQYQDLLSRQATSRPTTRAKSGSDEVGIGTDLSERMVDGLTAQVEKLTKQRDQLSKDRDGLNTTILGLRAALSQGLTPSTQAMLAAMPRGTKPEPATSRPTPKEFAAVKVEFDQKLVAGARTRDIASLINFVRNRDNFNPNKAAWLDSMRGKLDAISEDDLPHAEDVEWLRTAKAAVGQLTAVGTIQAYHDRLLSLDQVRGLSPGAIIQNCNVADTWVYACSKEIDSLTGTLAGTRFEIPRLKEELQRRNEFDRKSVDRARARAEADLP